MFTVLIDSSFNAGHAVCMPDGQMEEYHEHDWQLETAISTDKLDSLGFALEFGEVQSIINSVLKKLEGKNLNTLEAFKNPYPTTELVAKFIYDSIAESLPAGSKLDYIQLTEAAGCRVIYKD